MFCRTVYAEIKNCRARINESYQGTAVFVYRDRWGTRDYHVRLVNFTPHASVRYM